MNRKMRLKTVTAMLVLFATLTFAQESKPKMNLTLDRAVELALSENPTIKVAEQEIQLKEDLKKRLGKTCFLPFLLTGQYPTT